MATANPHTIPNHANHTSAQIHLNAELARINPDAYSTTHIASIRHPDGYGGYLHIFDITNHTKASHAAHRIAVLRMIDGLWRMVS